MDETKKEYLFDVLCQIYALEKGATLIRKMLRDKEKVDDDIIFSMLDAIADTNKSTTTVVLSVLKEMGGNLNVIVTEVSEKMEAMTLAILSRVNENN